MKKSKLEFFSPHQGSMISRRTPLFACGFILMLTLIVFRSIDIMMIRGTYFRALADSNRLESFPELPARGIFLDRNGEQLVFNQAKYFQVAPETKSSLYPKKEQEIDASRAAQLAVSSQSSILKEVVRSYAFSPALSHLLGYVGLPTNEESAEQYALLTQRIGKAGAEALFDARLRGRPGTKTYELSANGNITRLVATEPAIEGQAVTLAIDAKLSTTAYDALEGHAGAVVVSDVKTGQILTMVSSPSYRFEEFSSILHDEKKPLINRALSGYPPGSTFKLVTALAALQSGNMTKETLVDDQGQVKVGESVFRNWYYRQYGRTEGQIALERAIARSNDIYFYEAARQAGPEAITALSLRLGLGRKSGIGLAEEQLGLLPTPAWKEKQIGTKWFLGDTYHMGIGQGFLLATPLQINTMTAAIARGGVWCESKLTMANRPTCEEAEIDKEHIDSVVNGMVLACSEGGTAFPFFPHNKQAGEKNKVACKTGTAEFGGSDAQGNKKTHGWYTMFYPHVDPKVAITVFVEASDERKFLEGSRDAAPVGLKVFEKWKETYDK